MNIFNALPRPRVLFEDVPEDILASLVAMVPTCREVQNGEDVHESEFDVVVTFADDAAARAPHLHVLSFGANVGDPIPAGTDSFALHRYENTLATEISIPPSTPARIRSLLTTTVVPHVSFGEKFIWSYTARSLSYNQEDMNGKCIPLLHLGSEHYIYAFMRRRSSSEESGLSMFLPMEATGHAEWLRAFLDQVAEIDPASVPPAFAWTTSDAWATPQVRKTVHELQDLEKEREQMAAAFKAREELLDQELQRATIKAKEGPQLLLTADGDELTRAVVVALGDLGFVVEDMDDHHDAKTGAKLEDLRVADPSAPGWQCLAEVKGYLKGAKVSDVAQITGRPAVSFTKETGEEPTAVWHIVNAWRATDPSSRPKAIDNDAIDLQPLTDAGGAHIDTRQIYQAWRDVQDQIVDAESVRASLRSALTRWSYIPPT